MKEKEIIKVYIDTKGSRVICICQRGRKGCNKPCAPDVVERNRFAGWKDTFQRNQYGK